MSDNQTLKPARQPDLLAAALLGLPAILSFILILHHPTLHGIHGSAQAAQHIQATATLDGIVHGGLMLLYGMQAVGFYLLSAWLGWRRPAVVAAFMAYTASVIILAIPATLDGFVTPDIIAGCLPSLQGCADAEKAAFPIIGAMIQDFTKVALVTTDIATLFWSLTLLSIKSLAGRAAGVAGLLCGAVPMGIMLFSNIRLQPGNLAVVILAQVIWSLIAAALMMDGAAVGGD